MFKFCVLGSGSRGNATYIESDNEALLIDAGFSGVEMERRLADIDASPEKIAAILVTHEHHDHLKGVGILARKYGLTVIANGPTLRAGEKKLGKIPNCHGFTTGESFNFAGFSIHPFSVSHDSADPVGFVISREDCSLGYCTDTGMVSRLIHHRLSACHGLIIEANHDPEMLMNGPYPLHLQQRVRSRSGHLANEEAARFIGTLVHDGLQHVVLAHLSETNNDPSLALDRVMAVLDEKPSTERIPRISLGWQGRVGEVVCLIGGGSV